MKTITKNATEIIEKKDISIEEKIDVMMEILQAYTKYEMSDFVLLKKFKGSYQMPVLYQGKELGIIYVYENHLEFLGDIVKIEVL